MATADDDNGKGDDEPKGKKKLLFIVLGVVLLIGVGAGLYFAGVFGGGAKKEEAHEEKADDHGGGHGKKEEVKVDKDGKPIPVGPAYYELPEFLVNLSTTGTKVSFLKMKVTMELKGHEDIPAVDAKKPRILDAVNTYLRELRASDLSGSAGIYRLREELLLRVNKALHPVQVTDILFSEIIVQ